MRKLIFIFVFGLTLLLTTATFASLTSTEMQLREYVSKQQKAQLALLKKLVNINSGTSNIKGVNQIAAILSPYFKQLGFEVRLVSEPAAMQRGKTLIAERKGKLGKHILLIAHLDTVFPKTSRFQRFEQKKNSASGPGITDDKGGLVVILYALKALHAAHALQDKNITVVLTGDEEDSGKPTSISRKPLIDVAKLADIALDFEPAVTIDTATIARRGISLWTLETQGQEGHSASMFHEGVSDGAIFELARILNTMRTNLKNEKYLSFNPGVIVGGTKITFDNQASQGTAFGKTNVISATALCKGDLRFLSKAQEESAQAKMQAIVTQSLLGTRASLQFQPGIPAMSPTEKNKQLLDVYSQVSSDLGQGSIKVLDPGLRGAGDISHVAAIVPANLAGLGPLGYNEHSENEHIELNSLPIQTTRAAIFIYRLF